MNEEQISYGTSWVYVGFGKVKNCRHKVISVNERQVTTWGEPSPNPEEGGQSWLGTPNDFRRQFRRIA